MMTHTIDDKLLADLGLSELDPEARQKMKQHISDVLEERVGTALASRLTDHQLDEFETFVLADDRSAAGAWLQQHLPDYRTVVAEHFDDLCAEISTQAGAILSFERGGHLGVEQRS